MTVVQSSLGNSLGVVDICYSQDGRSICTAGINGDLQLYVQPLGQHPQPVHSWSVQETLTKVAWCHPDFGTIIAAASASGAVYTWRISSPGGQYQAELHSKVQHSSKAVTTLSFAPKQHGLVLATGGADGMVRMYSATSLASPCSWALTAQFQAAEAQQGVAQLSWRPQGAAVLATLAVMAGSSIGIWEYDPGHNSWSKVESVSSSSDWTAMHWFKAGAYKEQLVAAAGTDVQVYEVSSDAAGMTVQQDSSFNAPNSVLQLASNQAGTTLAIVTDAPDVHTRRFSMTGEWNKGHRIAIVPPGMPAGFLAMMD